MRRLEFFIEHAPAAPNRTAAGALRAKMSTTTTERTRAYTTALTAFRTKMGAGAACFTGRPTIRFELRRARLIDDDNVATSIKHYRDGLVRAVIRPDAPWGSGDGPKDGPTWEYLQVQVPKAEEGVFVMIAEPEPHDPPNATPFSGML